MTFESQPDNQFHRFQRLAENIGRMGEDEIQNTFQSIYRKEEAAMNAPLSPQAYTAFRIFEVLNGKDSALLPDRRENR